VFVGAGVSIYPGDAMKFGVLCVNPI